MKHERPTSFRRARWLFVLLPVAFSALSWAGDVVVEFISPRNLATALGPTQVEVQINLPEGLAVRSLELTVDGEPLATLTAPPWKTTWDAGDGSEDHRLKAVAHLSDGTSARAIIHTSALRINQIEQVDLVNLYVIVRVKDGTYVTDLKREDFSLLENGRPQVIQRFSTERKPLRIGVVLDTSRSMRGKKLESSRKAAIEFLGALESGDEGMVVTFSDDVQILRTLTADREQLASAILSTQAGGGTALYDAIWRTAQQLQQFDGRRVMVLLSDGKDEAANGLEPGSLHTLDEALDQALRSEVMIFAIGFGGNLANELDFYRRETRAAILSRLADVTGGRVIFSSRTGQLKKAFQAVEDDLRHQYSIAYVSDDTRRDGKWREIRLTAHGRDVEVITRKGYFAPEDIEDPQRILESK